MAEKRAALTSRHIAAGIFILAGFYLAQIVPTVEIAWVVAFLLFVIFLFAFEIVSVDVAAIVVMVLLGLTGLLASVMGLEQGLVPADQLFAGFSSNAVISIIAVMIIGAGLDKTGIMSHVASFILRTGGTTEKRIIPVISGTVGVISSFMQNVGAAALFLPVVSRISARTGLPMSRLLMPMGFCAILGGTVTMVGSSPLILLNDLIVMANESLPAHEPMATFQLFAVAPIGLALVVTGILYFVLAGRFVLPVHKNEGLEAGDAMLYFTQTYGMHAHGLHEVRVPADSPLVGVNLDDMERRWKLRAIGVDKGAGLHVGAEGIDRNLGIEAGSVLCLIGAQDSFSAFAAETRVQVRLELAVFADALSPAKAGIAELVIPAGSSLIGKTARDVWMRKTYGLSLLVLHRKEGTIGVGTGGVRDTPFEVGDTLVVYTTWDDLARLETDRNFVVVTTEYPHEEVRPHKVPAALFFFAVTLGLVLFTDLRLSIALLTGAIGMVLAGVLSMEEAYQAVSWKTVFLLAGLIPLGVAVEDSGTAAWIAERTLDVLGSMPVWVIQAAIAVLATVFTLVMSNVGATVLLVPLAVDIAIGAGANPAEFALTVAVSTSNSFIIPTHQVNALIMGPAGYRVTDFMRAGGVMTILFLVVSLTMLNLVF